MLPFTTILSSVFNSNTVFNFISNLSLRTDAMSTAPFQPLSRLHCLRHPVHPDVTSVIGNFSSSFLLAADVRAPVGFVDLVRTMTAELTADLEHTTISGVEVMEEYNRVHGSSGGAVAPFVFVYKIQRTGKFMLEDALPGEIVPQDKYTVALEEIDELLGEYSYDENDTQREGEANRYGPFIAGATITGGKVKVIGCGTDSLQGDTKFADTMGLMDAQIPARPRPSAGIAQRSSARHALP